ncbi:MAG: hypothetical protein RLZZ458_1086 [Planctomycetota bacterium]
MNPAGCVRVVLSGLLLIHAAPSFAQSPQLADKLLLHVAAEGDYRGAPSSQPLQVDASRIPLGTGDFTISTWLRADADGSGFSGDLFCQYDAARRRGVHLTLKTATGVTSCQSNWRHLQFGIDDDRNGSWEKAGRPGNCLLAFALAVHKGELYAGTCEPAAGASGRVYRYAGGSNWVDCGAPDKSNSVTCMAVYHDELYVGTGKYRVAGSSLPESPNMEPGGRIFRLGPDGSWVNCGQLPETEAVGGLVVFRDRLYASSLYRPAGFFRMEPGSGAWTSLAVPQTPDDTGVLTNRRVESMHIAGDHLYAGSYDGGHVYRWDGSTWRDLGRLAENTQTYSFVCHNSRLLVGTWPSGRVYSHAADGSWKDEGRLGEELEVMGMQVHNGRLFAGSLPLGQVYTLEGPGRWQESARLDLTPDVKYRRVWTMAEHAGALFCSTLPSGEVHTYRQGQQVTWGHSLPDGWQHVAAVRAAGRLLLYVNGEEVAKSAVPAASEAPFDLTSATAAVIGSGTNGPLGGFVRDFRVHARALGPAEIRGLASEKKP